MVTLKKKINYFYIDESGNLNNSSNLFIHGCIKTDSPQTISEGLLKIKDDMLSSLYYENFKERILSEGFHATENHFDMRAEVYKLLPLLDYRSYFVLLNKKTEFYRNLKLKKEEHEIFSYSIRKLLTDRIKRNKQNKNIFIFERIQISGKGLNLILSEFFSSLSPSYDCEYKIVGKDEENMGVIDYLNFIFNQILSEKKPIDRMKMNFDLVTPKIGVINILHNNVFMSRKKKMKNQININNLFDNFSG